MIILLSPAKNLDMSPVKGITGATQPEMLDASEQLVYKLRKQSAGKLSKLMKISADLGRLNHERYQVWELPFTKTNAKPAILAFNGEVYRGLDAASLSKDDRTFGAIHVRILSGLYGVLRPLDLMQAYRLEMGCRFAVGRKKNLYDFWGRRITDQLNSALKVGGSEYVINLASAEYFRSVKQDELNATVITPVFKDFSNGSYRPLMAYAKLERGRMCRYIIQKRITDPRELKDYAQNGYAFSKVESTDQELVFLRKDRPTA